jgi:hypothetical protein
MPERNLTSHCAYGLVLVLGVAGFVLSMATVSSELRLSHLAASQIPITYSRLLGAEAPAAEQEDRLTERMRQREGMGTMSRVRTVSSGQATREYACATPTNPDRDLRFTLAMMAIQQRRIGRQGATSGNPLLVLTEHSVAPPDVARWANSQQRDPAC